MDQIKCEQCGWEGKVNDLEDGLYCPNCRADDIVDIDFEEKL